MFGCGSIATGVAFCIAGGAAISLPVAPSRILAGDVDGDGSAEIVTYLVWPYWSSRSETEIVAGALDVKVVPAIRERRELRAYELAEDRLEPIAEPLPVGLEFLGLAAAGPRQPVHVVTNDGVARLVVRAPPEGKPALALEAVAAIEPLIAGAERSEIGYAFVGDVDSRPGYEILLPVRGGLAIVGEDGSESRVGLPLVEIRGSQLKATLPRVVDLDRDGTSDLVDVDRYGRTPRAAWRKGLGRGRFAAPVIWDLQPLLEASEDGEGGDDSALELLDVRDTDADGTLEALVRRRGTAPESVKGVLRQIRGVASDVLVHALPASGEPAATPERAFAIAGHPWPVDPGTGGWSAVVDLDGDGSWELVTVTLKFGYFGVVKAIAGGKLSTSVAFHVYALGAGGTYREVERAIPPSRFKQDLRRLESAARYLRFVRDIDGDGIYDLAEQHGRGIRLTLGAPGLRYTARPRRVVDVAGRIGDLEWLSFADLDGRGWLDLIAFYGAEGDDIARPGLLEVQLDLESSAEER